MSRRSAAELRELLVAAGLRVLYRNGLRATATHVPMTAAIAELEHTHGMRVSMGSVFGADRLWGNVAEYQLAVLRAAIEDRTGGGPNDRSLHLIHEYLGDMRSEPFEHRADVMTELCRLAGQLNGYVRPDEGKRRTWDLWVGLWAIAVADPELGDQLVPALREEVEATSASFEAVYRVMLVKLALRLKRPYTIRHLATLAAAITDGVALRTAIDPTATEAVDTPHGAQPWNLLGVGLRAIVWELLEDDAHR